MLKITDIKNINFRKANLGGYRPEDVDEFIDEVTVSYDQLLKDNAELTKQIETLNQKIETYRADEDNIRAALMNAQKLGEASIRESKHKSDIILKDAAVKSERIVTTAQREVAKEEEMVNSLRRQIAAFKTRLMLIYKEHMSLIEALPDDDVEESSLREQRPVERTTRISDVMDVPDPAIDLFPDDDEDDDFDSDVLKSFSIPKTPIRDDDDGNGITAKRPEAASNIEEVINPFNSFLAGQKFPVSPVSFGQELPKESPQEPVRRPANESNMTFEGKDSKSDKKRRQDTRVEEKQDKRQDKRPEKSEPVPEHARRRDRGGRRGMAVDMADREDNDIKETPQWGQRPFAVPEGDAPRVDPPRPGAPESAPNDAGSRFGVLKFGDYEDEDDKDDAPMGMFRRRR